MTGASGALGWEGVGTVEMHGFGDARQSNTDFRSTSQCIYTPLCVGSISELLDRVTRLCPLPSGLQRLIALSGDDSADLAEIVQVLGTDPALANQVMRVANSAAFGHSRKVADLRQAVVTIGLSEIHTMATGMAMVAAFGNKDATSRQLHEQSFLAASLARRLSKGMPIEAGTAALCGLLGEIGALACLAVDAAGYAEIWRTTMEAWDGHSPEAWKERTQREMQRYGAATPRIGAQLLNRNSLPLRVVEAVDSTLDTPATQGPLGCITAISRVGSLVLFRCVEEPDVTAVRSALELLAETLKRVSLTDEQVMNAFIEVAVNLRNRVEPRATTPRTGPTNGRG
jgi:HD-like signal output (HDOD) protein